MFDKDVFVYHLDNELWKLFSLNRYNSNYLYAQLMLLTKIAFLTCKDKILIPASNFFESDISFKILNELKELNEIGSVSLISSSHNINELLGKKISQHGNNISHSNYHYIDFINNNEITLPGKLNKRNKSASKDIKLAWYTFVEDSTTQSKLFDMTNKKMSISKFEDALYEMPHLLGEQAYISQYIIPLLPISHEKMIMADYYLNTFITRNYIASFLDEFQAACLWDMPLIDSNLILPDNSEGKYCYIPFGKIANLLLLNKYKGNNALHFIKNCTAYELIEFKHSLEWIAIMDNLLCNKMNSDNQIERNEHSNMENFTDIKIGVITALPKEYAAMKKMMKCGKEIFFEGKGAGHRFYVGEIESVNGKTHKIALALCEMGNNQAAIRATNMINHFKSIESIIMTGIAGGIPSFQKDDKQIRLGDIVVSEGITQYDFVKETPDNIVCRSASAKPSSKLIEAVRMLQAYEFEDNYPWQKYVDEYSFDSRFSKPSMDTDILHDTNGNVCNHCEDDSRTQYPKVFFGKIASANSLLKDPEKRNKLKKLYNVLAVEMEASGIADATWNEAVGYLVVRGICDYCDTYKNDLWQEYAALVAAAYTRSIIEILPCE